MENKINIAELLKDCPKGMELDCAIFVDNCVEFNDIADNEFLPIRCRIKASNGGYNYYNFTKYGCWIDDDKAKCVIFPKGKTTWEGFVPPCKFEDGDVLVHTQNQRFVMSIYHKRTTELIITTHCILWDKDEGLSINHRICCYPDNTRLATEEEKQKLFDAIKANGYKWNAETKTLEKLVEPKFKVGDRIRRKNSNEEYTIISISDYTYYYCLNEHCTGSLGIQLQDDYELVPDKFDVSTLIPFESRVLVRDSAVGIWLLEFFGCLYDDDDYPYMIVGGTRWKCCIPYEGNEHLLGKTDDCDEYYKTWE